MVIGGELSVLDTADLLAEFLQQRGGGGLGAVSVVASSQTAEDEHGGNHVLHTVVTVGKVVHLLELLVDDTDACLVCAVGDFLDVLGTLAHGCKLGIDLFSSLNGSLRVELGY